MAPRLLRVQASGAAVLVGGLAGAHLAGLLLFLNPELTFDLGLVARSVGRFAPWLVAVSLLLHAPFVALAPQRVLRALPWLVSAALVVAAIGAGWHASHFGYYLPAGINRRLLKAAVSLGVGGLAAFYTALLHTLHRRPYGPRSRLALWLLALGSLYVVGERREAYRPVAEARAAASVARPRPVELLVVGIEGASLEAVLPLAEQGQLPFLAAMLRDGSGARLRPLAPLRREPSWVTVATGMLPYRHRIQSATVIEAPYLEPGGALRLLPWGLGWVPRLWGDAPRTFRRADRRGLPLWEILARLQAPSGVVGWPTATPAPAGIAFAIGEEFFAHGSAAHATPSELAVQAALFEVDDDQLDDAVLEEFPQRDRATTLAALRQDLWRATLAFFLWSRAEPPVGALFLRLPGLAVVSEKAFGGFLSFQADGRRDDTSTLSHRQVVAYYRYLDDYLAQLWRRSEEPRLLAVVSAHGYARPSWGYRLVHLGPAASTEARPDAAADGLLLLRGDGVRGGAFLHRAGVEDVTPTLLYALGLPVARDQDGQVLTAMFEPPFLAGRPLTFLPSYEALRP